MKIEQIRKLCFEGKIKWSIHGTQRLIERGISNADVISCIANGKIIEDYDDSFPLPSCLIFGKALSGKVLHVVVGTDFKMLTIVTAYFPTKKKFKADLKTRKK